MRTFGEGVLVLIGLALAAIAVWARVQYGLDEDHRWVTLLVFPALAAFGGAVWLIRTAPGKRKRVEWKGFV